MFWYVCTVFKNMIIIFIVEVVLIAMGYYVVIINSSVQHLMILLWYILGKQSNYWHFLLLYWGFFSRFNISLDIFFMMFLLLFFL